MGLYMTHSWNTGYVISYWWRNLPGFPFLWIMSLKETCVVPNFDGLFTAPFFLVHVKFCSMHQMIAWTIASTKADRCQHYMLFGFRGPNFSAHYLTLGWNKEICTKTSNKNDSTGIFHSFRRLLLRHLLELLTKHQVVWRFKQKRRRQRLMLDVVTPKHISRHSFDQEKVLAEFEERKEMGKFMWCFFGQVRLMKHHCLFPDR